MGMTHVKTIRCSSLPRIMVCPASLQTPNIDIDTSGDVAALGTAVHEVLNDIIHQKLDVVPNLDAYIKKYSIDEEDLQFLTWRGMEIWTKFKPMLVHDTISCERELIGSCGSEWRITGHLDVCAELIHSASDEKILVIIDWKSGYVERDYNNQLMGYAWLATKVINGHLSANGIPTYTAIKIVTAWLRAGVWDVIDLSLKDIDGFGERLRSILESPKHTYSPSDAHCLYCPRSSECPARAQLVQSAINNMLPMGMEEGAALSSREKLAQVYEQSKLLKRALEDYTDALKTTIRDDGPLPLPHSGYLTIQTRTRDIIHLRPESVSVLSPYLGTGESTMDAVVSAIGSHIVINKEAMLSVISEKAARGTKATVKRKVMTELLDAGCVTTTTYDSLAVVKNISSAEKEMP